MYEKSYKCGCERCVWRSYVRAKFTFLICSNGIFGLRSLREQAVNFLLHVGT